MGTRTESRRPTPGTNAHDEVAPRRAGPPPRVAIVVSWYNHRITRPLLEGAVDVCREETGREPDVFVAPGSYELPALALAAAQTGRYHGVCALGCLIRGETRHDRYIADAVAHGLVQATMQTGVPVAFGVLTVDTPKQARARSGGREGNKGREAMAALLHAVRTGADIRAGRGGSAKAALALLKHGPDKADRRGGEAVASVAAATARKAARARRVPTMAGAGGGDGDAA